MLERVSNLRLFLYLGEAQMRKNLVFIKTCPDHIKMICIGACFELGIITCAIEKPFHLPLAAKRKGETPSMQKQTSN
jgi:hypothetical protein